MRQYTEGPSPDVATALTVPQAAHRLGVHEDTVRRWIKAGTLPAYRLGPSQRIRVLPEDVDRMVTSAA